MGGIPTDVDGRVLMDEKGSTASGLYAAGECACVSVHGANRLGCNSLLDLLVFGRRSGVTMKQEVMGGALPPISGGELKKVSDTINRLLNQRGRKRIYEIKEKMQTLMMERGSVIRNEEGLKKGIEEIQLLKESYKEIEIKDKGRTFNFELMEALELGHQLDLAEVILVSALHRRESRGAHYRKDFPGRADRYFLKHTLVFKTKRGPEVRYKPVRITRFQPEARVY